jgi:hypothetical protein
MPDVSDPRRRGALTRRRVLEGAGAAVLASLTPAGRAGARPLFLGSASRGATGTPLQASLVFSDGNSITVTQDQATDIGTFVDSPISQRCFRYYVTGYGDYRDAIVIDFRPESDGGREEVVFWLGCFFDFSTSPPTPIGSVSPVNLFTPTSCDIVKSASGTGASYGYLDAAVNYVWADGVSNLCVRTRLSSLKVDDEITITPPPAFGGATHYNVYITPYGGDTQFPWLQNDTPIALGTPWSSLVSGIRTSGTHQASSSKVICTVTVSGGNKFTTPRTETLKNWFWTSRFRIQSAERPVIRTDADLVTMKACFPKVTDPALTFGAPVPSVVYNSTPMGHGGLTVGMFGVGARYEIGPETEWFAAWRYTGDAGCLTTVRANGDAVGTMPINACDSATGAPIDTNTRQYFAFNNNAGVNKGIPSISIHGGSLDMFQMSTAHAPNSAFEAWHLTKDPYYLEASQFMVNWHIMFQNSYRYNPAGIPNSDSLPNLISRDEARSWGWGMRGLFQLVLYNPEVTPSWLLPRSHWQVIETDNKTFYQRFLNRAASCRLIGVFGMFPFSQKYDAFMIDFIVISLAHAVWAGLSDWLPYLQNVSLTRMKATDATGTSGWDNRYPTPAYVDVIGANKTSNWGTEGGQVYLTNDGPNTPADWPEYWAGFVREAQANYSGYYPDFGDPATWTPDELHIGSYVYLTEALCALGRLSYCGFTDAVANYNLLATRMKAQLPVLESPNANGYRWATKVNE